MRIMKTIMDEDDMLNALIKENKLLKKRIKILEEQNQLLNDRIEDKRLVIDNLRQTLFSATTK